MRKRIRRLTMAVAMGGALLIPAAAVAPAASAASCNQSSSVRILTNYGTLANGNLIHVPSGAQMWPVGITQPNTSITFSIENLGTVIGQFRYGGIQSFSYTTRLAGDNCVVDQPSNQDAPQITGQTPVEIFATYTAWENGPHLVNVLVGQVNFFPE